MKLIKKIYPFLFIFIIVRINLGQEPEIEWQRGPTQVDLGKNLAGIEIDSNYAFAGPEDTRKLMTLMGNPPSDQELGMIVPIEDGLEWFILFEYKAVGYVKDDDKRDINHKALLKSITDATNASNQQREEMGGRPLHVVGWYEQPHYDENTHNLVWAILAESGGDTIVNYNTRLLGRTGFTSVVIVASVEKVNVIKPKVERLLSGFSYKKGKRYFEFVEGDKVAKFGLTALVAGGAGAAAVKFGLLKFIGKIWKVLAIGFIAIIVGLKSFFKRLFGLGNQKKRDLPEQQRTDLE